MSEQPIYTIDIETDPFLFGRRPVAFAIGFYDGQTFTQFWGEHCIEKMFAHVVLQPEGLIYAHNGGRFDVLGYLMKWVINNPMRIISSRIIKSEMNCGHEIRDSYAIMPFPLGAFKGKDKKLDIDIAKLEKPVRQKHKKEIIEYLRMDCVTLWNLCNEFVDRYGAKLTIGGTAMGELKKIHEFENLDYSTDADLRSSYFYGGRTQYFENGLLEGSWKVYDVNSMYPYVMKTMLHPIGAPTHEGRKIGPKTCFVTALGNNRGAFPMRMQTGGISFAESYGEFSVSRHEWDAAMETGLFDVDKIIRTVDFEDRGTFAEFVDKFYQGRLDARKNGDEITALFLKFILNSAYGKFAQSRENYREYVITDQTINPGGEWKPESILDFQFKAEDNYIVWSKPSNDVTCFNVATGASITGGARSVLLRALACAKRPIYCDTDSVICEDLPMELGQELLGAWKIEAECNLAAIGRKKLYALFESRPEKLAAYLIDHPNAKLENDGSVCVKKANKGVMVTPDEIRRLCGGEVIHTKRDAPSFKLNGKTNFIERRVRKA